MNRTSLRRLAFVAITAPALVVGGASLAMADSVYKNESDVAGPHGAASYDVFAAAVDGHGHGHGHGDKGKGKGGHGHGHGGGVIYIESADAAGPHGAASEDIVSVAD
ncbi:hypothetical protein [Nocardiopsis trehalosi]|uniref:hypothetical protein n=1 Tax=Nocardiopsis trehalosi TaxID=109329 RepID=UPI00083730B2|nr:hypothetical protein [Nocardiopsis trehalosi]